MSRRIFFAMGTGLGAVLAATTAQAATYHVAPGGDDAAEGSRERPWRTLQHAADVAQAGDTVTVGAGDYEGFNVEDKAGKAEAPLVFSAEPGARVVAPGAKPQHLVLDPVAASRTWPEWPHGIHVWASSYVVIEGFEVRGMPNEEMGADGKPLHRGGAGIHVEASDHVTVRKNLTDDNGRWGILTGFTDDLVIEDNECSRSHTEHGIYVGNSGDRAIIRRNLVWGNHGSGIQINADNNYDLAAYRARGGVVDGIISGAVVEANVLHDNGEGGGSAINLDGVQDSLVANNLLHGNHGWGVALFQIDGAEGSRRNRILHNTIVMADDGRYAIQIADCPTVDPATSVCAEASDPPFDDWDRPPGIATGSTGNVIANNILLGGSGSIRIDSASIEKGEAAAEPLVSDANLVVDGLAISEPGSGSDTEYDEVLSLAGWRDWTGQDERSQMGSEGELFTDSAAGDFSLRPGSAAVDSGWTEHALDHDLLGRQRPAGAGPDIGAYELGGEEGAGPGAGPGEGEGEDAGGGCAAARGAPGRSGALAIPVAALLLAAGRAGRRARRGGKDERAVPGDSHRDDHRPGRRRGGGG